MKFALLDGKEFSVDEAISHNDKNNVTGFVYSCLKCGGAARIHRHSQRGKDGHFEHQKRDGDCPLYYKG